MKGFSNRWTDFPDYIIGITREIWEGRGIETLNHYYAPEIPVRTPMGVAIGNQATINATMATIAEFPDRQLFCEDVIWSRDESDHYLSSHRIITTGTHLHDGAFGPASGRKFQVRVIADCAARADVIDDEWLVRDYGGIVRQLGLDPVAYTRALIAAEGGPDKARRPFSPAADVPGPYTARGNDNDQGARYGDTLKRIMLNDFAYITDTYDRACIAEFPGARQILGSHAISEAWLRLRSSFPSARFTIHHQIGMDADAMPARAAIRWSLDGTHDGLGWFGKPTGAPVHVMGISHAEFGPWGLRREYVLFDEIAIWKQILLHTGEL